MDPTTNFDFLHPHFPELAKLGALAEATLYVDPGSCLTRLRSLAEGVTQAIHRLERLPLLPQANFNDLLRHPAFEAVVDRRLCHQLHYLRKEGNETAHGGAGDLNTANAALKVAHQLAQYMAVKYAKQALAGLPAYAPVPHPTLKTGEVERYKKALTAKAEEVDKLLNELEAARAKAKQAESTLAERETAKAQAQATADSLGWDEATTRRLMIDTLLAQAGWDLNDPTQVTLEHPVEHQPTAKGIGYADYVLWDDSGKPLAVIEAKRASAKDVHKGREQARIYADGLEKMTGQRPVIFYTNGYETYLWDDCQYNSYREVYGFYSRDSLNYLLYQRTYRAPDLEQHNPKTDIAGRSYQIEAIKAVAHRFQLQRRQALIVQATGTGKTRVAIAISELLTRTGWAKRILFLCDRRELRRQADDAFKTHLPTEPRCVIGQKNAIDTEARIYVSTYPGMMGRFHQLDVGFFDLIIADESHRSIYNKYRDIFDYFDALQLGLTATPVKFIARNTYDLFGCEDQDPTFAYGLEEAVNNDPPFLVPFRVRDVTTEFLREGIHYNDLTPEQQAQLEQDLGAAEAQATTVKGKDIGRRIYSTDTDTTILTNLMQQGIKDATGSLIGKTIVFAQSQGHAEHLEKLFTQLYPQYGTRVCKVIHNKVTRADALIDEFKTAGNDFRIAISVDMLDTGIDVPEVVNLVFAKPVRSWVKFWQMIGRGTRLCEHLFGPDNHKTEFLIFDHYGNFTYFEQEYQEAEEPQGKSILQHLFEARLQLLDAALKANHRDAFDAVAELIRADLADLPDNSVAVRKQLRTLHQLQQSDALTRMDATTRHQLAELMAPLMGNRVMRDPAAIALDRLMAGLETCLVNRAACLEDLRQLLLAELDRLAITINAVRQKDALIDTLRSAAFWANPTIADLEHARRELRGIMKYRQSTSGPGRGIDTTGVKDEGQTYEVDRPSPIGSTTEALAYRRRLKTILDQMVADNPVLQKVRSYQPVRPEELEALASTILTQHPGIDLGVLNDFYGRPAEGMMATLRELVGMDPGAVEAHFTAFLHAHPSLTHLQVRFMNQLKQYISEHGTIRVDTLYDTPFTAISHEGIDGVFTPADVDELFAVLEPYLAPEPPQADA